MFSNVESFEGVGFFIRFIGTETWMIECKKAYGLFAALLLPSGIRWQTCLWSKQSAWYNAYFVCTFQSIWTQFGAATLITELNIIECHWVRYLCCQHSKMTLALTCRSQFISLAQVQVFLFVALLFHFHAFEQYTHCLAKARAFVVNTNDIHAHPHRIWHGNGVSCSWIFIETWLTEFGKPKIKYNATVFHAFFDVHIDVDRHWNRNSDWMNMFKQIHQRHTEVGGM